MQIHVHILLLLADVSPYEPLTGELHQSKVGLYAQQSGDAPHAY
jgi:hypothetical protein